MYILDNHQLWSNSCGTSNIHNKVFSESCMSLAARWKFIHALVHSKSLEIADYFSAASVAKTRTEANYNVAPSVNVPVIVSSDDLRQLDLMR